MTRRTFLAATAASAYAAGPIERSKRTKMGFAPDCFRNNDYSGNALEFLQTAYDRGGGGVQAELPTLEPDYLKKVRERVEQYEMNFEVRLPLPMDDTTEFEATVKAAIESGARCLRSVCLIGRRYETFGTMKEWNDFDKLSRKRLALAVPILDRHKFQLGLENHKDYTNDEFVPLLKSYESEYLRACIDMGNNVALLDSPLETVKALAPYAVNSHIKDLAVEEYEDGFLLSEVPLGTGISPLKEIVKIMLAANPKMRFSLDHITRDPLKITCLTERFWNTQPDRSATHLATMMRIVRENKPKTPLTYPDQMKPEDAIKLEDDGVQQCVDYARDELGLRYS